MMLTISGLPLSTKYKDLKELIKTRCNLADFIVADLVVDNGLKKARVGLADASEGAQVMKCLSGFRLGGCVLNVTPVGKTQTPGPPQNFDPNQNFNQFSNNYNEPRPSPWGQQPNQNQWGPNAMGQPGPNSFGYQQNAPMQNNAYMPMPQHLNPIRPQHQNQYPQPQQFQAGGPQQGYGFQNNNVPDAPSQRQHVLRAVKIVDTAPTRPAAPGQLQGLDKPIMKDKFQGPDKFPINQGNSGPLQGQNQPNWGQQPHQKNPPTFTPQPSFNDPKGSFTKPQDDRGHFKDYDREPREIRTSPFRRLSPRVSPGRRLSPGRLRRSPGRHSPGMHSPGRPRSPGRGLSPRRHGSPGGRLSLRRDSPGRQSCDFDRRMSPRRRSPMGSGSRPQWTARRLSPDDRSPNRRLSPGRSRLSPTRHLNKPEGFTERAGTKPVRPAYDPSSQEPNQASYSGGYRPNVHQRDEYPEERPKISPWQQDRDKAMFNETIRRREEERNMARLPFSRRSPHLDDRKRSRSPLRREKSPSRDRFKRRSPSPRRSWATDRRPSSPLAEPPPPPLWPGQDIEDEIMKIPDIEDPEPRREPVWEYNKNALYDRRPDDPGRFPAQGGIRIRGDLQAQRHEPEFKKDFPENDDKYDPIDSFEIKRPKFSPREDVDKKEPAFGPREDIDKRGPKLSPRENFDRKEPVFGPRHEFSKSSKFSPKDDFDIKIPKFSPRDDFDSKESGFRRRDDFTTKPKFSPRDDYDDKRQKFSHRDDYQDPKFNRRDLNRDPKFSRDFNKSKFSPRDDFDDRRDDFRKHDVDKKSWGSLKPATEVDAKRGEVLRMDVRRDVLLKMSKELDKQFEDVHKRAQDFHKRAEEYRREDRRKDYDRRRPESKGHDDKRKRDDDHRDFRLEDRRQEEWKTDEYKKTQALIHAAVRAKKEKAGEEIAQKILDKHNIDAEAEHNARLCAELRIAVNKIINEMFGDEDVSFIELIVKFNAKYSGAGEDKVLRNVLSDFPPHFKPQLAAPEPEEPAISSRFSAVTSSTTGVNPGTAIHVPEWNMTPAIPHHAQPYGMYPSVVNPVTVGAQPAVGSSMYQAYAPEPPAAPRPAPAGHNLYLCKDDFQPFTEMQADFLRKFLIDQIVKVTETSQGWAPDFTFTGLQGSCRYELHTVDEASKDWLINFDFSVFSFFNILVYTKEELWYERAAIWLPGHSRYRSIEPLAKLKLQNKKLEGVNVGKWKFVKKVVTVKGTRVYVDMPPSSARALEKHQMSLSYELNKVSVFLKAVAIDKDAFDKGLKDPTLVDEIELKNAALSTPMPTLGQDPKIVKICLAGNKPLTVVQARKIREMLIYHIFSYHQQGGNSSTDFVKYGLVSPGYLGIIPDNAESKRWLMELSIGKLNRQQVIILGSDDSNTRFIVMSVVIPNNYKMNSSIILEKLKHSNQGVKGINFNKWKPQSLVEGKFNYKFSVKMDIESVETIINMQYTLDFVNSFGQAPESVKVKYEESEKHLLNLIKRYKSELQDTYDNANMDLASSHSESEADGVETICLE